ncbi:thymosin beta-10-like [Peromyscus leucopus]|nr:thymosin beta-10-like [Peromyscus leucopus]
MADKLDMKEISSFHKARLKKAQMQEKVTMPTKDSLEQEKRSEIL